MQLLTDNDRPSLLGTNPSKEDIRTVKQMVAYLNDSLKDSGYNYEYTTKKIGNELHILKV